MNMKNWISVAVTAAMLSTAAVPAMAKSFPDADGHWAKNAISTWSDHGVLNGDDQGNFRPNDSITRAETSTVLDNLIGYEKQSVKVFSDVHREDWFALAISRLYEAGVITGYEDGTIRPTAGISRQEAAVMIGRALGLDTDKANLSVLDQFSDRDLIQSWAKPTVALMLSRGYIQGSDGAFRPGDPITRAELVTIIDNMVAVYATESGASISGDFGNKLAVVKNATNFNGVTLGGMVISPKVSGKVNLNSGTKINGHLYSLSTKVSLSTAGATVDSVTSQNGLSNDRNYSTGSTGGSGGSGFSGGGSGGSGSSQTTTYRVTFMANGGGFGNDSSYTVSCSRSSTYRVNAPGNPTRAGYTFVGWYFTQTGANELDPDQAVNMSSLVSGNTILYAGWEKISGKYGDVLPATGSDVAGTGKSAAELMTNLQLNSTSTADHYLASGALKYVNDYESAPSLSKEGNFIALTYTLPSNLETPSKAVVKSSFGGTESEQEYKSFTAENRSFTRVFYVTSVTQAHDIVFTVDLNGDGKTEDLHDITIDISALTLSPNPIVSETVTTEEAFVSALQSETVNQIVVDGTITLKDQGNYAANGVRKTVIISTPFYLAKDASVQVKNLDFKTAKDATCDSLFTNTNETVTPAALEENDQAVLSDGESNITEATALTMESCSINGKHYIATFPALKVKTLTLKNNRFYSGSSNGMAIVLDNQASEGSTVTLTGNTFDGYAIALVYGNAPVDLTKNVFLDNKLDVTLAAVILHTDPIPVLAKNYYKDGILTDGFAITAPLYTDETCSTLDTNITKDTYLLINQEDPQKLTAEMTLTLPAEGGLAIKVVPLDTRNTVKINTEAKDQITVAEPGTLTIQIGEDSYTVTVEASQEA